jgi:hypothetical protein
MMALRIIEASASIVLKKVKKLGHPILDGKLLVIRKKPHAIAVALGQNIPHNY